MRKVEEKNQLRRRDKSVKQHLERQSKEETEKVECSVGKWKFISHFGQMHGCFVFTQANYSLFFYIFRLSTRAVPMELAFFAARTLTESRSENKTEL